MPSMADLELEDQAREASPGSPAPSSAPPRLLILYGSETGNAQDAAERISLEARRRGYESQTLSGNAYAARGATKLPLEPAVVWVVSTTGAGEFPTNFRELWRVLLRRSLPPDSLAAVSTAVFGLGDSGYAQFCTPAKKLARRLQALGASAAAPLGLGDDQHPSGADAALDPWLTKLWAGLRARFPAADASVAHSDRAVARICRFRATPATPGTAQLFAKGSHEAAAECAHALACLERWVAGEGPETSTLESSASALPGSRPSAPPCFAPVVASRRLTAEGHEQHVRHLEVDLSGTGLEAYPLGAVLSALPRQRPGSVQVLLDRCHLDGDEVVRVEACRESGERRPFFVCRVYDLVAGAVEVAGLAPRRAFFEILRDGLEARIGDATSSGSSALPAHQQPAIVRERDRLAYFCSSDGRADLHEYAQRERRPLLDVLSDFETPEPSLAWLLHGAPRLRPRAFSLASASAGGRSEAAICAAVVEWTTPLGQKRRGLCSSWLATLGKGDRIPIWIDPGTFALPPPAAPLIMVGAGTGLAPFRGFVQHLERSSRAEQPHPPSMLCVGHRSRLGDDFYREEWEAAQASQALGPQPWGILSAFSRDQERKVYVQHRIREHARDVWELVHKGAWIFVCGSSNKMPADVKAAFRDAFVSAGGLDDAQASALVRQLELTRRYQVEAWA